MNKTLKYIVLLAIACFVSKGYAQELKSEVFSLLNLDYPGLEKVKALHQEGKDEDAAKALLDYYRARTNVKTPDINLNKVTISKEEQQWADDGLKHTFFVHKGYQPSYNYGEDINWQYWPVKDNELRWQLHRHKWFTPMGKAYRISGDEKYAKEWAHQYIDWIKKNPLVKMDKKEYELVSDGKIKGEDDLISGLKTQHPTMFEASNSNQRQNGNRRVLENNLPGGDKDKTVTKRKNETIKSILC